MSGPTSSLSYFPRLQALRARTGGPGWIVIDEAHHLLPASWGLAPSTLPQRLGEIILITYRPAEVAPAILSMMDIAVAVGPSAERTLADLATTVGLSPPPVPGTKRDEAIVWEKSAGAAPFAGVIVPARSARLRHLRKYAEGDVGPNSFFFRGAAAKMNLRAQNLTSFCDLASGVDDDTWVFHLRRRDYSAWIAAIIRDDDLARDVAEIEQASHLAPLESRRLIRDAIDGRYMLRR